MKVVSFFSGCGGVDLGFEQAGFEVVWANDNDPAVSETIKRGRAPIGICFISAKFGIQSLWRTILDF